MPWTFKSVASRQFVEANFSGDVTANDLRESTSDFIALEKESGLNRFLINATDMSLAPSYIALYELPTKHYIEQKADREGRIAIMSPTCPKAMEAVKFYENVCRNRGWMVQVFANRKAAEVWLTESRPPGSPDTSGT